MHKVFNLVVIVLFCLITKTSFAHVNDPIIKKYNNISGKMYMYDYSEGVNKQLIALEYSQKLCEYYGYKGNIDVIFYQSPNFKINSFNVVKQSEELIEIEDSLLLTPNFIIHIRNANIDISKFINLVEYALISTNLKEKNIEEVYNKKNSEAIYEVLSEKIYRPNWVKEFRSYKQKFNYYVKGGCFYIIKNIGEEEIVLKKTKDIIFYKDFEDYLFTVLTKNKSKTFRF